MKKLHKFLGGLTLFFSLLTSASAQNLITNGDFSSTSSPVGSSLPVSTQNCRSGRYKVTNDFYSMCNLWVHRYDHTLGTASGGMLIIDDTTYVPNGSCVAWSQSVNVVSGVTYDFSFWANAYYSSTTYPLKVAVKAGTTTFYTTPAVSTGSWTQYKTTFTATSTGPVTLKLVTVTGGIEYDAFLDYAIDDIVFTCEVVVNGNFSDANGLTNCTLTKTTTQDCASGKYMIASKFLDKCWSWPAIYDHTSGNSSGKFLIIDNGNYTSQTIWSQYVNVVAGNTYTYTIWVNPLYSPSSYPMTIYMNINGAAVRSVFPSSYQTWSNYDCSFYANYTGTATLSLTLAGTSGAYRDFGIDDISFSPCVGQAARPETTTDITDEESDNTAFKVYPNPSSGSFNIFMANKDAKDVYVYDSMGKIVYSKNKSTDELFKVDLNEFSKGLYVVKIISSNKTQVEKVVLQ